MFSKLKGDEEAASQKPALMYASHINYISLSKNLEYKDPEVQKEQ